jgi:large subunit ribosomal protein L33
MARNEIRPIVKLRSTAGTGYIFVTHKNRRNDPDRLVLRKYDPAIRRHVDFGRDRPRAVELCCDSGYPEEEKGLTG